MGEFPEVTRWIQEVGARPAVNRGFRAGNELREGKSTMTPEARKVLLNQRARRAKDG
jgi:GST-like protein